METEHALSFLDAFPLSPGHALVVPRLRHVLQAASGLSDPLKERGGKIAFAGVG
ncbi:MAG: HIT domain-containing protein [Kiritimatiellae bacterium]|nr:HIT domain-containing protein [Kiritimatiellia bacterium]MDD4735306.1 HIT domain-containing protein [Kiritimatiellia bacterium]